jgi:hypothetical protein
LLQEQLQRVSAGQLFMGPVSSAMVGGGQLGARRNVPQQLATEQLLSQQHLQGRPRLQEEFMQQELLMQQEASAGQGYLPHPMPPGTRGVSGYPGALS